VIRGSSGAQVRVLGDRAVKSCDGDATRLVEQGKRLQRYPATCLPHVFHVYAKSYVMEKLVAAPAWALNHRVILSTMFDALRTNIWSHEADVSWNSEATSRKVHELLEMFGLGHLRTVVFELYGAVRWDQTRRCLTHGDPTFDNVMFREDSGSLVLVDPLPATNAVPDLQAVDTGKILQSAIGWERVRYGDSSQEFDVQMRDIRALVGTDNDWRATIFWCFVHLVRTLPYVPENRITGVKELLDDTIKLSRRV
jgi:hypothetical protein